MNLRVSSLRYSRIVGTAKAGFLRLSAQRLQNSQRYPPQFPRDLEGVTLARRTLRHFWTPVVGNLFSRSPERVVANNRAHCYLGNGECRIASPLNTADE
jgi:hypothetical protein